MHFFISVEFFCADYFILQYAVLSCLWCYGFGSDCKEIFCFPTFLKVVGFLRVSLVFCFCFFGYVLRLSVILEEDCMNL